MDIQGLGESQGVEDKVDLRRLRREVLDQVSATLRDLDVVSAVDETWAAILLPETKLQPAVKVAERLQSIVSEFQSVNAGAGVTTTVAVGELLEEHETGRDFFDYVHQIFLWALENGAGTVVSAETWKREAHNE